MRCRCFWAGGGKKQRQEQEQHEKGLSVSVLWKVPTCAKLISLLNARAPFAKRTQDRSGRSGPWSLPWASGLEEGITALHSKGSTPVRGCLANGSLGTDPPLSLTKRPETQEGPTGGQTEHKTRDNFSSASSIQVLHPVQAGFRRPSLAPSSLSVRFSVLLPAGRGRLASRSCSMLNAQGVMPTAAYPDE